MNMVVMPLVEGQFFLGNHLSITDGLVYIRNPVISTEIMEFVRLDVRIPNENIQEE